MEPVPIRCRIPDILESMGKTQSWLADRLNMSRHRISDYCRMRRLMSYPTGKLIADELNVPMQSLYEWNTEQE